MNNDVDLEIIKLIREYEHIHNHGNLHAVYNVNDVWNGAYYIVSFHFISNIFDKSIGLDNRLCLYKSFPTTRWNNWKTICISHRAIYPSCIHAIHLNYQA
jgi:hypothetical protein